MNKSVFIYFFFFFGLIHLSAQTPFDSIAQNPVDNDCNLTYLKEIDVDSTKNKIQLKDSLFPKIKEKYSGSQFDYEEQNQTIERFSWFDRLTKKVNDFFKSIFGFSEVLSSNSFFYFLILIASLLLIFIIYKLVASGRKHIIKDDTEIEKVDNYIEKNLEKVDLTNYLKTALENKNYQLAIRYLHLSNLKLLAEKNLIEWEYKKTNLDFYNELKQKNIKPLFLETSKIYDYIWFGEFEVSEESFKKYEEIFNNLKKQIT